jgi:geranyl-CoA carboxylase alpha subunit
MIAKIIAKGSTRDDARKALLDDLMELDLAGPRTNRPYLIDLLSRDAVVAGIVDISWLERQPAFADDHLLSDAGATAALFLAYGRGNGWTSTGVRRTRVRLRERDKEHEFVVENGRVGDLALHEVLRAYRSVPSIIVVDTPKGRLHASIDKRGAALQLGLHDGRSTAHFEDITYAPAEPKGSGGANAVRAPMAGRIIKVTTEPGQTVAKNQILVILEAMKMEHELKAAADGVVDTVSVKPGDQVAIRQTLVTLKGG